MASGPIIFGKPKSSVLSDVGTALLQVKNNRGLTLDDMRAVFGLKVDDMVAKYIAGEAEMGFVAWLAANEAWPELADLIEETTVERQLRARQRALDLDLPTRREKA